MPSTSLSPVPSSFDSSPQQLHLPPSLPVISEGPTSATTTSTQIKIEPAASPVISAQDAQKSAQALAQMLRSSDGMRRLNSLRPDERIELASKVQAFQRQLQDVGGTGGLSAASLALASLLTSKLQHSEEVDPKQPIWTPPPRVGRPPVIRPNNHAEMIQRLLAQKELSPVAGRPSVQQIQQALSQVQPQQHRPTQARPAAMIRSAPTTQQLLLMLIQQQKQPLTPEQLFKFSEEIRTMERPTLGRREPIVSKSPLLDQEVLRRLPPDVANILQRQKIEQQQPVVRELIKQAARSVENESLILDQEMRIDRVLKRRRTVAESPNSVESQVWKMRRNWSDDVIQGNTEDENGRKLSDVPLWDGCQFSHISSNKSVPGSRRASQVAMQYWWDKIFDEPDSDLGDDEFVSVDRVGQLPTSIHSNIPIITADGSFDNPLDICIFPDDSTIIAPMYPPPLSKQPVRSMTRRPGSTTEQRFPVLIDQTTPWLPQTPSDELIYSKLPNPPDRLLQELLRGKWHLFNDLLSPIPVTIPHSPPLLEPPPIRTTRPVKRNIYVDDFCYPTKPVDDNDFVGPPTPKRHQRRTPQYSPYGLRESISPSSRDNTPPILSSPRGEMNETPAYQQIDGSLDAEVDLVKRRTGWHPYVWYLMCRRPELYDIDIRARLVARVAGWEWDDIQKSPEILRIFLDRIWAFVEANPVPRYTDKKEAKEYKNFAASSVRTPWNGQETAAVRRALREMAVSTGADSDSIASDGGITTGHQTPSDGGRTPAHITGQQFMENLGIRLPGIITEGRNDDSLPSLVAKMISSSVTGVSSVKEEEFDIPPSPFKSPKALEQTDDAKLYGAE